MLVIRIDSSYIRLTTTTIHDFQLSILVGCPRLSLDIYSSDISENCIEEKESERDREIEKNIEREKGKRKEEIEYEKITYY